MKKTPVVLAVVLLGTRLAVAGNTPPAGAMTAPEERRIEQLTGAHGSLDPKEGVFKVALPRTDLNVTVAGVRITPAMGLTSWAAFERRGDNTMVMGDLVVLEDQVNTVMDAALQAGLEVTALHNHFLWDTPKVMFMHIAGMGNETQLAGAVGKVFARIKESSGGAAEAPVAQIDLAQSTLDTGKIDAILKATGTLAGGVYKVVVGRSTSMHGIEVGNTMGVNTWAAFAGSNEKAVVDGDFAMREGELNGVLKALRAASINITAIHQHMTEENPRIIFLHYWGVGKSEDLARGLRFALDQTATGRE